jgi:P4 family phage/plasmid primase-like protien
MDTKTQGYLGNVDALARMPDAAVLLVYGADNFAAAQQYFTANPVLGWDGAEIFPGTLAGRRVIIWPGVDTDGSIRCGLALKAAVEALLPVVGDLRAVTGAKTALTALSAREALQTLRTPGATHLYPKPQTSPTPAPAQPVEAPRKPAATFGVVDADGSVRAPRADATDDDLPDGFSQDSIAAEFTRQNPDWRYVPEWGKWMRWDKRVWRPDTVLAVYDLVRRLCREEAETAARFNCSAGTLRSIRSANNHAAVEKIARSSPVHARPTDVWDAQLLEVNTPDGILSLTNGKLRAADPSDYVTKVTAVGPSNAAPEKWLRFLADVTAGDENLVRFLQRMCGYCLSGDVSTHALFFLYGTGANGKSTFIDTVRWVLGDYARVASMETFTESKNDRHPQDLASLMGARMVVAQETEEGRRWAESRIKEITGGSPITARFMRQDQFTFQPQFKLIIVGNHKPGLRNVDEAMRRRLHLVPFTVTIPEHKRDAALPEKLRAEGSGILQWMLQGYDEFKRSGLAAPASVRAATDKYFTAQDAVGTWIAEYCRQDKATSSSVGDLYKSFGSWCNANGEYTPSRRRFADSLESRGMAIERSATGWIVPGVALVQGIASSAPPTAFDYLQD